MIPYASRVWATNYLATERMYAEDWLSISAPDQDKCLLMATRIIDRFKFVGRKIDRTQDLEFPRDFPNTICTQDMVEETEESEVSATVPVAIMRACAEIALHLSEGWNPTLEERNLSVASQGISSVRVTYDTKATPQWQEAGLPSQYILDLLRPYFCNSDVVNISRV